MKKTKILLLLLTLVMLISAFPIAGTFGDEVTSIGESDNGMVLNKTAVSNGDGTYTISLEAFATGTSFITNMTENVPTDIVIVVDQSGSMTALFEGTGPSNFSTYSTNYSNEDMFSGVKTYGTSPNTANYYYRDNMYVKVNSQYYPVKMSKSYVTGYVSQGTKTYSDIYDLKSGTQLYVKKNGEYCQLQIEKKRTSTGGSSWSGGSYTYTFTFTLVGDTSEKSSVSYGPLTSSEIKQALNLQQDLGCDDTNFYAYVESSDSVPVYTYSYNVNGVEHICTSTGDDTDYPYSDLGGSLYYAGSFTSRVSNLQALQTALNQFLDDVKKNSKDAQGNSVDNRVAIVGFASSGSIYSAQKYENTELFDGDTQYKYNNTNISNYYKSAFKDASTDAGIATLKKSVNALDAGGATCTDLGLDMAEEIFSAYNADYADGKRNKVVIVFTDGTPGYGTTDEVNDNISTANNAITHATTLKGDEYGATVYAVGVQAGADPTSPGSNDTTGSATVEPPYANWFLHNVSSNNGTVPSPGAPGYYLSASNTAELTSIFEQIAEQVQTGGTSIKLQEDTVIKDYVTREFDLHGTEVKLETYHCVKVEKGADGKTLYTWVKNEQTSHPTHDNNAGEVIDGSYTWTESGTGKSLGASYTIDYDKKLVSITGFNYSDNWVGTVEDKTTGTTTYRGNKIVLTFTVHPEEGFLGGNDVFTNTPDSGIYKNEDEDKPVDEFPVPDVDVTVPDVEVTEVPDIAAAAEDIDVYLLENVTLQDIKKHTTVTIGGAKLDLSKPDDNYGLADWQTEYVNISVVYKDASGNTFTSYDNLTADTTYTVVATVTPKKEGTATGKTSQDTGSIWVYKPVLTYKDNTAYYGGPAVSTDWETDYLVSTAWKHGDTTARTDIMGQAPTLNRTYTWDSYGKITDGIITTKKDIPVDVSVKIGNSDVSRYVTFAHKDCSTGEDIGSAELVVHVNTCSLTISKTGAKNGEPCVFTVLKDGKYYTQVTLNGQTGTTVSKTLYELPVGTYSIAEDEAWSWRYDASYSGNGVTLSASNPSATISCTNTETNSSWLNYFSEIIENIFGVSKNAD